VALHRTLLRHWNSAFSRGLGYESTPPGVLMAEEQIRGYYIDFRAKTQSAFASNPRAQLPTTIAQLALGWWERHLSRDPVGRSEFGRMCHLLRDTAVRDGDCALWLHSFTDPKYGIEPPWISALTQAQAASVFVRAHLLDGHDEDAELAVAAIQPLLRRDGWSVVADTERGPALEEGPSSPPSLILNGWIYALWGLRDVSVGLGHRDAGEMLSASSECLVQSLPRYDVGWWTRYSLYPHLLPDLAKPFYHRLHVWQAEIMYRITGEDSFRAAAARWLAYDQPIRRARLIAQKAAFVATGYR
jgi:heparosan-N-sulfate-glucuronate 5-epimerase